MSFYFRGVHKENTLARCQATRNNQVIDIQYQNGNWLHWTQNSREKSTPTNPLALHFIGKGKTCHYMGKGTRAPEYPLLMFWSYNFHVQRRLPPTSKCCILLKKEKKKIKMSMADSIWKQHNKQQRFEVLLQDNLNS